MAPRPLLVAVLLVTALSVLAGCNFRAGRLLEGQPVAGPYARPLRLDPPPLRPAGPNLFTWLPAYPVIPARAPGSEPYTLDSGDKLRVVVFGEDNLSRSYTVDGGGYISMPLIGAVGARGLTTFDLEKRIADLLRQKYVKDPHVSAEVEAYRPFFVLGEVRKPGQYPFVNGMTIETAVAIAGGYTERAKESTALITRQERGAAVTIKVPPVYPVRPGDTIKVTERFF